MSKAHDVINLLEKVKPKDKEKEYVVTIYYVNGEKEHFDFNAADDQSAIDIYKKQMKKDEVSYLSRIEKDHSCIEIYGTHKYSCQYE